MELYKGWNFVCEPPTSSMIHELPKYELQIKVLIHRLWWTYEEILSIH